METIGRELIWTFCILLSGILSAIADEPMQFAFISLPPSSQLLKQLNLDYLGPLLQHSDEVFPSAQTTDRPENPERVQIENLGSHHHGPKRGSKRQLNKSKFRFSQKAGRFRTDGAQKASFSRRSEKMAKKTDKLLPTNPQFGRRELIGNGVARELNYDEASEKVFEKYKLGRSAGYDKNDDLYYEKKKSKRSDQRFNEIQSADGVMCQPDELRESGMASAYEICDNGVWKPMPCAPGTNFDSYEKTCVAGESSSTSSPLSDEFTSKVDEGEEPAYDLMQLRTGRGPIGREGGAYSYSSSTSQSNTGSGNLFGQSSINYGGASQNPYQSQNTNAVSQNHNSGYIQQSANSNSGQTVCEVGDVRSSAVNAQWYGECVNTGSGMTWLDRRCAPGTLFDTTIGLCATVDANYIPQFGMNTQVRQVVRQNLYTKFGTTSQGTASQGATSQGTASQGATSQSATSQGATQYQSNYGKNSIAEDNSSYQLRNTESFNGEYKYNGGYSRGRDGYNRVRDGYNRARRVYNRGRDYYEGDNSIYDKHKVPPYRRYDNKY